MTERMTRTERGPVLQQRLMCRLLIMLVAPALVAASRPTPSRLFGRIRENSPAGTAVDGVELPTGPVSCSDEDVAAALTGIHAADFRLFWSQRNHLSLLSNKRLDREFITKYELRVALSCLRTPAVVEVEVAVLASEAAQRRKSRSLTAEPIYSVTVAGHARAGELVFTVPDHRFEHRRFELTSQTGQPVQVEPNTGRVLLTRSLSEPADIVVKVLKIPGDEWYVCRLSLSVGSPTPPQWTMFPSPYLAVASPDAVPGTVVYRLSSRQPEGRPGSVQFLLLDGGMGCFEVDHRTGEIRTTGLPLMSNMEYLLRVMVEDGLGQRGPEARVSVLAGPRPPQFTECPATVIVPENTEPAECVARFRAVSFQNRALSYVLVDPGDVFVLQKETGSLCLSGSVDYESSGNMFTLRVQVWEADTGLSNECEVTLSVTDVNDCTPEFSYPIYTHSSLPENVAVGVSLLQVVARDCDSGVNSQISYFLEDKHFLISSDGVISPAHRLDLEQDGGFYTFVVIAVDAGSPPRTGSASVRIRVSSSSNSSDESERAYVPLLSSSSLGTLSPDNRPVLSEDASPAVLDDGGGVSHTVSGNRDDSLYRQTVIPDFSFGPSSVVHLRLTDGSDHTKVQLQLRTRSTSGTLLSVRSKGTNESIALQISEGFLVALLDVGDGHHVLQLPGQRVDVGQWIRVDLSRRDNLFVVGVELSGGMQEAESSLGSGPWLRLDTVAIGGGPESDFQGCLRDVRLNGIQLPLDGRNTDQVVVLEQRGVTLGCTSDACRSHTCPAPMTCVDLWRKHQCRCPAGQLTVFRESGQRRCVPSPCGTASCQNGGTCLVESPDSFKCQCADGFRGRQCQLGQVKGHAATLSPSSILLVSMSLLVFFALLVAVTVWNQKGSRNKFRQRATLQHAAEQLSCGDVPVDLDGRETTGTQCSAEAVGEASCIVSSSAHHPSLLPHHQPASESDESDQLENVSLSSVWCHN
ncbi:uncharacterized protein ACB058_020112 isoform 1-T1 [Synchiropus picturatus]